MNKEQEEKAQTTEAKEAVDQDTNNKEQPVQELQKQAEDSKDKKEDKTPVTSEADQAEEKEETQAERAPTGELNDNAMAIEQQTAIKNVGMSEANTTPPAEPKGPMREANPQTTIQDPQGEEDFKKSETSSEREPRKRRRSTTESRAAKQEEAKEEDTQLNDESSKQKDKPARESRAPRKEFNSDDPGQMFDWGAYESGSETSSTDQQSSLKSLYEESFSDIDENAITKGKVVAITDKDVVLDIGFKSDGAISLSEFKYNPDLKVGDQVDVLVQSKEDSSGQLQISHKKALAESSWYNINDAFEKETVVKGYVKERTKGGMLVEVLGMDAFLPGSQIDVKPVKDYDAYVGTAIELKVVKVNPVYRNIVVSHKALIESGLEQQKSEILGSLEKGQVLEGTVKNITSFGAFVDLGGVDGLVHITDITWGRLNHPSEVLQEGQTINIVVLDYDEEKQRISLGMKQLTPHPWEVLDEAIKEESQIKGRVVNLEDYGAFVEIAPGVEGLVHVSEMSWSTHLKSPKEYVKPGDEVDVIVLNIDREDRKLSLGMKQLAEDPWDKVEEKYPEGSTQPAIVRSMTNFGLFCELEPGIDGLVHISDLSWTRKFNHPAEFTKVGEKMDVVVLEVDKENRRLSLGHKQLEEDPWDTFESIFLEGSVHKGVIQKIEDKGAIISMPYGVEAFAPKRHLSKADKTRPREEETLDFKVIEFDRMSRRIVLSHSDIWRDEERTKRGDVEKDRRAADRDTQRQLRRRGTSDKTTLADELDILAQLKSQMEEQDRARQRKAMKKMDDKKVDDKTTEE